MSINFVCLNAWIVRNVRKYTYLKNVFFESPIKNVTMVA